jgi:hypothetical protein
MDEERGSEPAWRYLWLTIIAILFLLIVAACTRETIPILPQAQNEIVPTEPPPAATLLGSYQQAEDYSVVWIPADEALKIHNPAGIAGTVIGELSHDQSGIKLAGGSTSLGSSVWVEIQSQDGITGWVNEWNLTETVRSDEFCADARIPGVLSQIIQAIEARDGQKLSEYVNPDRGLIIRHDWWNPEVIISYDEVPGLFEDRTEREWGVMSGGDFPIEGSFDELIRPLILETVSVSDPVCNQLPTGTSSRTAIWPGEYTTLNYSSFYRPVPENGNPFNWRTWTFTFEYVGGRPYLTVLVQFQGDI